MEPVQDVLAEEVDRQAVQAIVDRIDEVLDEMPVSFAFRVKAVRWRASLTGSWRLRRLAPVRERQSA